MPRMRWLYVFLVPSVLASACSTASGGSNRIEVMVRPVSAWPPAGRSMLDEPPSAIVPPEPVAPLLLLPEP